MRLAPWNQQSLTRRQWFNDRYRNLRGFTARDGTWQRVGLVSVLCTGILGAAVIGVGGGAAHQEAGLISLPSHASHLGWREPDPTTTTTPPTTVVIHSEPKPQATGGTRPSGSRQACILTRENPNDPTGNRYGRSTNPSHFGAYQFDKQTWAAAGGDPAKWGTATPAEQDAAFNNYVAHYGYGAWAPYDGC